MVTTEQLKYVESLYRDEVARDQQLNSKAQVYFSIVSLLFSAVIFRANDVKTLVNGFQWWDIGIIIIMTISILFSFVCVLSVLALHEFEIPTSGRVLIQELNNQANDSAPPAPEIIARWNANRTADFLRARETVVIVRVNKERYLAGVVRAIRLSFLLALILIAINL